MSVNRYGVDVPYFKGKLKLIIKELPNYTQSELSKELNNLAKTNKPPKIDLVEAATTVANILYDDSEECVSVEEVATRVVLAVIAVLNKDS